MSLDGVTVTSIFTDLVDCKKFTTKFDCKKFVPVNVKVVSVFSCVSPDMLDNVGIAADTLINTEPL